MTTTPFRIEAVRVGVQSLPRAAVFFGDYRPGLVDVAFHIWHLWRDDTHVLVDLGFPAAPDDLSALQATGDSVGPQSSFRDVATFDHALAAFGLTPDQIDVVLITQPIVYHSGGLTRANVPRARVLLPRPGIVELLAGPPGHPAPEFYFTAASWSYLRELAIEGRLVTVAESADVMPGLSMEVTGGHHPGSAAVHVHTAAGRVTLLETTFVQENVELPHPIGLAESVAMARDATARALASSDRVVAIHEPRNSELFAPSRRAQ